SKYDVLSVGHSSTSISAGLGIAITVEKENQNRHVVCVIGDGAITSGMAFEAMNHAGSIKSNLLIILNDNSMSISENVGALHKQNSNYFLTNKIFSILQKNSQKIFKNMPKLKKIIKTIGFNLHKLFSTETLFEKLGFKYFGPYDGHDIPLLISILKKLRFINGPKLLHILTKKGKGYAPAEKDPISWHAVPKFNLKIGISTHQHDTQTYSTVFGNWLCETAKKDKKLIAITPAMREGSGLVKFSKKYPEQYFDVAISEQHAVTFAAGLAIGGYKPVVAIYSTFLQRAYDQIIHDVAIQNLSVLFAIDRAGIVGPDGSTHQGALDLSYLRCIPNMIIMTPSDENECRLMLYTGYHHQSGPAAVRYPKGIGVGVKYTDLYKIPLGKAVMLKKGKNIAILNFGVLLLQANAVAHELNATLVDMRFVKPLDSILLKKIATNHQALITLEENVIMGGAGSAVNEFLMRHRLLVPVLNIGLPDRFIAHGSQQEVRTFLGLDSADIIISPAFIPDLYAAEFGITSLTKAPRCASILNAFAISAVY
uniref:1-deoxy-D-xylulose-5-phosphate synthase n=1 Tax=Glossina palpalis gambiensis TaxID=67801 RepID=A0A1B0C1R9_9MUSC